MINLIKQLKFKSLQQQCNSSKKHQRNSCTITYNQSKSGQHICILYNNRIEAKKKRSRKNKRGEGEEGKKNWSGKKLKKKNEKWKNKFFFFTVKFFLTFFFLSQNQNSKSTTKF